MSWDVVQLANSQELKESVVTQGKKPWDIAVFLMFLFFWPCKHQNQGNFLLVLTVLCSFKEQSSHCNYFDKLCGTVSYSYILQKMQPKATRTPSADFLTLVQFFFLAHARQVFCHGTTFPTTIPQWLFILMQKFATWLNKLGSCFLPTWPEIPKSGFQGALSCHSPYTHQVLNK